MPSGTARTRKQRRHRQTASNMLGRAWRLAIAVARLFLPAARGVYPPHTNSPIVLGIALSSDTDPDEVSRLLWWRGLGLIQRDGQIVAGADVTAAVRMHRVRPAHEFVARQLRDAGIRGRIKRWEQTGQRSPTKRRRK